MKIFSIQSNNYSRLQYRPDFTSKVKKVNYGQINDKFKDKVDKFDDGDKSEAKYLGHGMFASVYRFLGTNFVIKKFNKDVSKEDSRQEAKMLAKVGAVPGSQQLMAQVTTENNNEYLISTFIKGEEPDPVENPFKLQPLRSFMNTLYELDKKGVYHNDLNTGNCKVDPQTGQIGLIDYQFACDMKPEEGIDADGYLLFPKETLPANLQMFEMATLPPYIKKLGRYQAPDFFKDYLKLKGEYYRNRYYYYKNANIPDITQENLDYERLSSVVLRKPTEKIIQIYAKKLQVFQSFRHAFGLVDENTRLQKRPNLTEAIPAYLYASAQAADYRDKIDELMNSTSDLNTQNLMKIEKKVAEFWLELLSSSALGCSQWFVRNAVDRLLPGGKDAYPEKIDYYWNHSYQKVNDIYSLIAGDKQPEKADVLRFPSDSELEPDYKQLFNMTDDFSNRYIDREDNKLFARFKSQFNLYKNALDSGKVILLPALHIFAMYGAFMLYKHGNSNRAFRIYEKLDKMSEPLFKAVIDAVKGEGGVLTTIIKNDPSLNKFNDYGRMTNRKFSDFIKNSYIY